MCLPSNMAFEILSENTSMALLFGGVVFLASFLILKRRPSGIPPFPVFPLPVIGNLLSVPRNPTHLFEKWRKEHGDIFSLYLGSKLYIVLNGYECVKEALVKNADVFSDRPDLSFFSEVAKHRGFGGTSGAHWKSLRTFTITALSNFGFGRTSLEGKILEESEKVVKYFASKGSRKENVDNIFNMSTSNILCSVVFGHRYEYDDPVFIDCCKAVNDLLKSLTTTSVDDALPFLRYFPGDLTGVKQAVYSSEQVKGKLVRPEIERHLKEYDGTVNDFISAFIKEIKDRESAGENVTVLRDNFDQTIVDLFAGGTETTATTLKWLILFLIHYPEVQERCFQEIKENIGSERLPELKDKPLLPYVEATFAETQRLGNIVPFAPHGVARSTIFRGFNIPKEALILVNLSSVLMDPQKWSNPKEFNPERFLKKDGTFPKQTESIPFSTGRRVCLGAALAKMEIFLIGCALIQRFCFEQPEDEPLKLLEPVVGITYSPMSYRVRAVPRK